TIRRRLDPVETDSIDVDQLSWLLDIQLHQVEDCRSTSDVTDFSTLLRRIRLRTEPDCLLDVLGPCVFEGVHCDSSSCPSTDSLDCSNDIRIGATTADVPAHKFLHVSVRGTTGFFHQGYR